MPFITLTLIGSKRPHRFRTYDIESFGTTTANESFVCMASGSIVPVDETTERIDRLIAEAEADDDCAGCQFDPDAVFELTPLGEECLGAAGKLYPVAQSPAKLLELVDEAQSDAKVADERTRWFKKLAEKRLAAIEKLAHDRKLQAVTIEDATGRISGLKQRVDALAVELEEWRAGKRSRLENQHGYVAGEKIPRPNKWSSTYNDFNRE